MTGQVGDRIVIESERVGKASRQGEILEARESAGRVNYRVHWDDGQESEIRPAAGSAQILPASTAEREETPAGR